MIKSGERAYCVVCNDRYSDENFCLGKCCGKEMMSRPYTEEELATRKRALSQIRERVAKLQW